MEYDHLITGKLAGSNWSSSEMALKNFLVLGVFLAALLMFSLDDVAHARELTEANGLQHRSLSL